MDITVLVVAIGGGVILLVGLAAFILSRSWGDSLPRSYDVAQYRPLPVNQQSYQPNTPDNHLDRDDVDNWDDDEELPINDTPPDSGLILIDHPLLRNVIEQSLANGGPATRYVERDGDQLYVSLDLIENPQERRMAAQMLHNFQKTGTFDVWDVFSLSHTFRRLNVDEKHNR